MNKSVLCIDILWLLLITINFQNCLSSMAQAEFSIDKNGRILTFNRVYEKEDIVIPRAIVGI